MQKSNATSRQVSRRGVLKATAAGAIASWSRQPQPRRARCGAGAPRAAPAAISGQSVDPDFRRLDAFIREAMTRYDVPGLAVGVLADGRQYTNGYGITNKNAPLPVDASTLLAGGLDHEDLHGDADDAAGRAGPGGPRRAGAALSARPATGRRRGRRAGDGAAVAESLGGLVRRLLRPAGERAHAGRLAVAGRRRDDPLRGEHARTCRRWRRWARCSGTTTPRWCSPAM